MEEAGTPKTKRYWRENEIVGLNMTLEFSYLQTAETPDEYHEIIKLKQRLEALQVKENRLVERFERIRAQTLPRTTISTSKKPVPQSNDWVIDYEGLDIPF